MSQKLHTIFYHRSLFVRKVAEVEVDMLIMTNSVDGKSNFSRQLTNFYKFISRNFFGGFSALTTIRRIRIYGDCGG